jgi:hypothetical protein
MSPKGDRSSRESGAAQEVNLTSSSILSQRYRRQKICRVLRSTPRQVWRPWQAASVRKSVEGIRSALLRFGSKFLCLESGIRYRTIFRAQVNAAPGTSRLDATCPGIVHFGRLIRNQRHHDAAGSDRHRNLVKLPCLNDCGGATIRPRNSAD